MATVNQAIGSLNFVSQGLSIAERRLGDAVDDLKAGAKTETAVLIERASKHVSEAIRLLDEAIDYGNIAPD